MNKVVTYGLSLLLCLWGQTVKPDIWSDIESGFTTVGKEIEKGFNTFVSGLDDIGDAITTGWDDVEKFMDGIGKAGAGIPVTISNLDNLIANVKDSIKQIKYIHEPQFNNAIYPDQKIIFIARIIAETFDDLDRIQKTIADVATYFIKPFNITAYNEVNNAAIIFGEIKDLLETAVNIMPDIAAVVAQFRNL